MPQALLSLSLRPQLGLTPRLQQSVKLLQLSALECVAELHQAIDQNPFLEEAPESADPPNDAPAADGDEEPFRREALDFTSEAHGASPSEEGCDWTERAAAPTTLRSELREQLLLRNLCEREHALADLLIDALDDDGYLREPLEELAALTPSLALRELEGALGVVQSLEPCGIAARSLAECIALQLEALEPDCAGRTLALAIARGELETVAARDHSRLRQNLGCTQADLERALELIRSLDPRPGSKLGGFEPSTIVPDVIVRKEHKRWAVAINTAIYPRIRVNQHYAEQFRRARLNESTGLAQHLQEARWLVRNLEQRFLTIERVAQAVVTRQRTFFEYGDLAMRPLTLREIADELGIHESTVSRATSQKYMSTPRGVVPFKRFFSRELTTLSGGSCSATAIRAVMRELIAAENPRAPLSDVDLARLIGERGVKVARRTVTKYRRSMRLPPVDQRRL